MLYLKKNHIIIFSKIKIVHLF